MEDPDRTDLLLEQWKMASELHRHMDNIAWQALNFFIATNGALVAALGLVGTSEGLANKEYWPLAVSLLISIGVIFSITWGLPQLRQQA